MSLYARSDKVAFFGVPGENDAVTFHRMKNFTSLSKSKNSKEYSRQYVDEKSERTDVVGYAESIGYNFDLDPEYAVHKDIVEITDKEKIGDDAVRTIINVDMKSEGTGGKKKAIKRNYSIIPDAEGDSLDAYTYSGNFKATSEAEEIEVTVSQDGLTITVE